MKKRHALEEIREYVEMRYDIRRNALTLEMEVKPSGSDDYTLLDEAYINSIWFDLQIDGFKCSESTLMKIINNKSTDSVNPLSDYLLNLAPYDHLEDYIDLLAKSVTISDIKVGETHLGELWKPYLEKWLVASVATVLTEGINHACLILVGGQGVGKTTWLNQLCPPEMKEFLICSHINPSLTDVITANYLAEKWFVNIDDQLETIFGKDFNSMKAIITAPFVSNRKTWHRYARKRKRMCSFMGSVNNPQFLTDSENRRYLVFSIDKVQLNSKVDMNKVWAQSIYLLNQNYRYWFSAEEIHLLNQVNDYYRQPTAEEEWLVKVFTPVTDNSPGRKYMMNSEILTRLIYFSGLKLNAKRLNTALKTAGFGEPQHKRIHGKSRRVYLVKENVFQPQQ